MPSYSNDCALSATRSDARTSLTSRPVASRDYPGPAPRSVDDIAERAVVTGFDFITLIR